MIYLLNSVRSSLSSTVLLTVIASTILNITHLLPIPHLTRHKEHKSLLPEKPPPRLGGEPDLPRHNDPHALRLQVNLLGLLQPEQLVELDIDEGTDQLDVVVAEGQGRRWGAGAGVGVGGDRGVVRVAKSDGLWRLETGFYHFEWLPLLF
jgi:hypothetical protein